MKFDDLKNILGRLRADHSGLSVDQWKLHVLDTISGHLQVDKANFVSQHTSGPPSQIPLNTNQRNNKAYLDHFHALNPLGFMAEDDSGLSLAHGPKSRNIVVRLEDVIDRSSLRKSEYYKETRDEHKTV